MIDKRLNDKGKNWRHVFKASTRKKKEQWEARRITGSVHFFGNGTKGFKFNSIFVTFLQALLLLDYCLHVGSENVVLYAKENAYVVKTLKEFQHVEENGKDVGANGKFKRDIMHD